MVKFKDKIQVSKYLPPKNVNSLWYNGKELKIFNNGKWNTVGGGSGGGGVGSITSMMLPVTWEELVALRDAANLTAGQMYRITDYETMTSTGGSQAAGHPFDIIVTALDNKTLDEKASAIWSARDTEGYFANSNLPAWDVRYCLDNDTTRFGWAVAPGKSIEVDLSALELGKVVARLNGTYIYGDTTFVKWEFSMQGMVAYILTQSENVAIGDVPTIYLPVVNQGLRAGTITSISVWDTKGKGVIYRLSDEKANSLPYDFKNIMFLRKLNNNGEYDAESGTETFVYTFNFIQNGQAHDASIAAAGCMNNITHDQYSDLPNNVFLINYTSICFSNEFKYGCLDNTFVGNVSENRLGVNCIGNTFGTEAYSNILGNDCKNNRFGEHCGDNILEDSCVDNTLEGNDYNINLKGSCSNNLFGKNCRGIVLGVYCSNNSIKGESSNTSFLYITFKPNVKNVALTASGTSQQEAKHYIISVFDKETPTEIEVKTERSYDTFVTAKSDGTIVEYTIDDILNS